MSDSKSITDWFERFKAGDKNALAKVWDLYFDRLIMEARGELKGYKPQAAGEVDFVQSAFRTFLRCGQARKLPEFHDPEHLYFYLARITRNKVLDLQKHEKAEIHGGGRVIRESNLRGDPDQSVPGIDGLINKNCLPQKPSPALPGGSAEAIDADALRKRFEIEGEKREVDEQLDAEVGQVLNEWINRLEHEKYEDLQLRKIAKWLIQGDTSKEIAIKLGCRSDTVDKKLRLIRKIWKGSES